MVVVWLRCLLSLLWPDVSQVTKKGAIRFSLGSWDCICKRLKILSVSFFDLVLTFVNRMRRAVLFFVWLKSPDGNDSAHSHGSWGSLETLDNNSIFSFSVYMFDVGSRYEMSVLSLVWLFLHQVTRQEWLSCNSSWGRVFWHAHYQLSILLLRFAVPFSFWFVLWDKLFSISYYSLLNKLPDKCNLAQNHEAVFFGLLLPDCLTAVVRTNKKIIGASRQINMIQIIKTCQRSRNLESKVLRHSHESLCFAVRFRFRLVVYRMSSSE